MTAGPAMALPQPAETTLTAARVLATAVWAGGLVAIFVVTMVADATLGTAGRVAFFRGPERDRTFAPDTGARTGLTSYV